MNYYTKKSKFSFKIKHPKIILVSISILIIFNSIIYFFDKSILPSVLNIGEEKARVEATNIINETALEVYSEDFSYEDMIIIEKDDEGNISMLRADTIKLNYLSSKLILKANKRISDLEEIGLDIPLGYMTENLVFHNLGPEVNMKVSQIGSLTSSYESVFESAGINQTRHTIYLNVHMKIRIIVPMNNKEIEVVHQIPIAETIIVGKIPNTAIELNKN